MEWEANEDASHSSLNYVLRTESGGDSLTINARSRVYFHDTGTSEDPESRDTRSLIAVELSCAAHSGFLVWEYLHGGLERQDRPYSDRVKEGVDEACMTETSMSELLVSHDA
jgi:hypothetical protein